MRAIPILTLLLPILSAPALTAQEASFRGEVVEVRVVDVPVQVTDSDGNPIVKLHPSDFDLLIDGKLQPIQYFFEVKDSEALRHSFAESYRKSAANAGAKPEFHKRIILLFDAYHTHPHNYLKVSGALETFLGTVMVPGDKAAIYMAKPSVSRLLDWTGDISRVRQAVREFKISSTGSTALRMRETELNRVISRSARYQFALGSVRSYAQERTYETLRLIDAIQSVIDINSSVPGEKYLVFIGEGIPQIPGLDYFYLLDRRFPSYPSLNEALQYDMTKGIEKLGRLGASNGFTFYMVDARGLITSAPAFGADISGTDFLQGVETLGKSAAVRSTQDSLRILSEITGGRAVINTNDFKQSIGRLSLSLNHYYSLGFEPSHSRDGRYHEIEVRSRNPEFEISYRKGYFDFLPGDRLPIRLKTYLVWDQSPHNPLGIDVAVKKSTKKGGRHLVTIALLVPVDTMPFENGKVTLRVGIVIGDEEGRKSDPITQKVQLSKEMWNGKKYIGLPMRLLMRKGRQTMILGVEDPFEDISYVRKEIRVPVKN